VAQELLKQETIARPPVARPAPAPPAPELTRPMQAVSLGQTVTRLGPLQSPAPEPELTPDAAPLSPGLMMLGVLGLVAILILMAVVVLSWLLPLILPRS
jgi:hypothetical protein